jgi:1-acyl-sn-glycerol-3-phosphate acyltransferase
MRVLAFNLLFFAGTFFAAFGAWALAHTASQARLRAFIAWWCRVVIAMARLVLNARYEIRGRDRLPPGGPQVMAPKHQSELDVFVLYAQFPDLSAIVMAELEKYPFFGAFIRKLELITVAVESGPQGRTAQVLEGAKAALAQGRPVLIYPEGTLMSLGARERYRAGVWRIYAETGAAVTPVAQCLGCIWPRREWRKRLGGVGVVEFLDAMPPGMEQEAFMTELQRRIEEATMALIREHAAPDDLAAAEDRYARGVANED